MSCNRENVVWQSADGTWNCGHWAFHPVNQDDPNWDFEWDVEYEDHFHAVTVGHPSEHDAQQAWSKAGGANPGGGTTVPYTAAFEDSITHYEELAAKVKTEGNFHRGWYRV